MSNQNEDTTIDTMVFNKRLMNNIVRLPFEVETARGSAIRTVQGHVLLDFWGDEGVCSLGYNTEEYRRIVDNFHSSGQPHQLPDVYPQTSRFNAAEKICQMTDMDRIFFANSGTEANEAAIKIARKFWWDKYSNIYREGRIKSNKAYARRHIVLTIAGNFHGRTGLSSAASDPRVSPYHHWGFGPKPKGFGVIDDKTFLQVVTDGDVHEDYPIEPDWSNVAAVILAPVLGNNLVKTYSKSFWEELGALRKKHGFLIIHDDVQAGSGRAGWPATYQGISVFDSRFESLVKPDILCLGKGMALGYPMSAMLASEEVASAFTPGVHFNTFGGSPFVCYLAEQYYSWLELELPKVRDLGEAIRLRFSEMAWIKEHDGSGLLNAFTPNFGKYGYDGFEFCHKARDFGISIVTHRRYGPIRFTPPMNVAPDEIATAFIALERTHKFLTKEHRSFRLEDE